MAHREPGKIVSRRGVLGGKPVFAGTRIPVTVAWRYRRDPELLLDEYPSLTSSDVRAARRPAAYLRHGWWWLRWHWRGGRY